MQSWLIGVGWVIYGGQLFGCWFHDAWLRAWAETHRGRAGLRGPLAGRGEQDPGNQSTSPG
jgi:hypothetical protein